MSAARRTVARSYRWTPEQVETLERLADVRFAGNQTAALGAAVELAAIVYGDAVALRGDEMAPSAALAAYCRQNREG